MKDQDKPQEGEGMSEENMGELEAQNKRLKEQLESLQKEFTTREEEIKELKAINESNMEFYENAPCGFHVTDENGLILRMNKTELDRLGYTREEVEGKMHILDILSEKNKVLFYKYLPEYREKGFLNLVDVEYKKKDGSLSIMSISIRSDYDEKGNFKGGRTYLWDISDRDRLEKEMLKVTERFKEAKQVLEEKSAVLDKLNHEILEQRKGQGELNTDVAAHVKQPLDKALAICNQLINDPSFGPGDQVKMLQDLLQSIESLDPYLKSFKGVERMGMEQSELNTSRFSLSALLVTISNRMERVANKKGVTLTCEIYKEYWLQGDKEFMSQVMDRLLVNAIAVAPRDSEIVLKLTQEVGRYLIELEILTPEKRTATTGRMFPPKERASDEDQSEEWNLDLVETLVAKLGYEMVTHVSDHGGWVRLFIPIPS